MTNDSEANPVPTPPISGTSGAVVQGNSALFCSGNGGGLIEECDVGRYEREIACSVMER